ncbi:MAG: hypothetical protein ACPG4T_03365 [Nannocystaceae bacterium]
MPGQIAVHNIWIGGEGRRFRVSTVLFNVGKCGLPKYAETRVEFGSNDLHEPVLVAEIGGPIETAEAQHKRAVKLFSEPTVSGGWSPDMKENA